MRQTRPADWRRAPASAIAAKVDPPTHKDWYKLESSLLSRARYDRDTRVMHLEMVSGHSYPYAGVSESLFIGLLTADSPGTFYNKFIKGKFTAPEFDGPRD